MNKNVAAVVAGTVIVAVVGVGAGAGIGFKVRKDTLDKLNGVENLYTGIESQLSDVKKQISDVNDINGEILSYVHKEESTEPEFVTIDNRYEIKDTKAISDAYISGNTDGLDEKDKETLKMASDVIDEVTNDKMSVYEKEVAIYRWMRKNINFDSSSLLAVARKDLNCYTPYGVLKGKNAVCVGYATTFKLFMNMLGLDCMVEHDRELTHSWDIVKLDDDEWYLVDVTFDGSSGTDPMFTNFNCTNTVFEEGHTWNQELYPIANGLKYSYAAQNAVDCQKIEDIPAKLKAVMDKNKSQSLYLRLPDNADLKYLEAMLNGISNRLNYTMEDVYLDTNIRIDENGKYILVLNYQKYGMEQNASDEDKYKGLTELLNKYFGAPVSEMEGEMSYSGD